MTCSRCGAASEAHRTALGTAAAGAAVLALGSLVLVGLAAVVVVSLPSVTGSAWLSPSWPRLLAALLAITGGLLVLGAWQLLRRRRRPKCRHCGGGAVSLEGST